MLREKINFLLSYPAFKLPEVVKYRFSPKERRGVYYKLQFWMRRSIEGGVCHRAAFVRGRRLSEGGVHQEIRYPSTTDKI